MKKFWYIFFTVLFFLACLVPSVGMVISGPSEAAANETPALQPKLLQTDGSFNADVLAESQSYISKGFFGRLQLITAWDTLCARLLHTSANDDVLIGPDGWLFFGGAVNDISGDGQLTEREIWCAARGLFLMQEYVNNQGATFLFAVPCGKYTLYPDHAPDYITVAEGSNRERLNSALEEQHVHTVNLYDVFSEVDEELYWKLDSHWNSKGAALAADAILTEVGLESRYFAGPFTAQVNHKGDLYEMLYPAGTQLETDYAWEPGFTFIHQGRFHSSDDITIETENPDGTGSLLMFRDSSGRNLYPYMAQSFGHALFSRLNNYRLDYIAQQEADTVVVEIAERTLPYLLSYPAAYPAPVRNEAALDGLQAVPIEPLADGSATLEGYTQYTGSLPVTAVDSPVYVQADNTLYEAIPNEGSFTVWLPKNAGAPTVAFVKLSSMPQSMT